MVLTCSLILLSYDAKSSFEEADLGLHVRTPLWTIRSCAVRHTGPCHGRVCE